MTSKRARAGSIAGAIISALRGLRTVAGHHPGQRPGARPRRWWPPSLRAQICAMVVVQAALSFALAGTLMHTSADRQVEEFGRRDLQQTADRLAVSLALGYADANGWSVRPVRRLLLAERKEDHMVVIRDGRGRRVGGSPAGIPRVQRRAAVRVSGRRVGTVIVGHSGSGYLEVGQGRASRHLDFHTPALEAAVLAALVALVFGVSTALRISAPLQRVTAAARRMAHGTLEPGAETSAGSRETRELAETLDRLAAALRRQDELRRATAADIAHEMRNAMFSVFGRLEAIRDGYVHDERAALDRVAGDARRLERLVADVSALAEAQRPALLVHKRPADLDGIAAECVAAHADRFGKQAIALRGELEHVRILADPPRLTQILDNLLSNALRYTDAGGSVTVRVVARGEHAVLEVEDTGIGIPPEYLGRVFDRFWRAPAARDRAVEGFGVGLAIVRDLTVAHDGRVEVESRPGRGSTFRVVRAPPAHRGSPATADGEAAVATVA